MKSIKDNGLTTSKALFINDARENNMLFINQPYALYSGENQKAWKELFQKISPVWKVHACQTFLKGVDTLKLSEDRIPDILTINNQLAALTNFSAKPVSGYVPAFVFFDCLKKRVFPTTITIRDHKQLDYLPEPDIFHDVAGHVPMHTDPTFANTLVKFGSLAQRAIERMRSSANQKEAFEILQSNLRALSRFFWFTVEFGLIREQNEIKAYGSGLLSSFGELIYATTSHKVQRKEFQLEWVINQPFKFDQMQPLLFVIDSFEMLFAMVEELEKWLLDGKLDHVAFGDPLCDASELQLFINKELSDE